MMTHYNFIFSRIPVYIPTFLFLEGLLRIVSKLRTDIMRFEWLDSRRRKKTTLINYSIFFNFSKR